MNPPLTRKIAARAHTLPAGSSYTSDVVPGLCLLILKKCAKYKFRYTYRGEKGLITLADTRVCTLDQAEELAYEKWQALLAGEDPRRMTGTLFQDCLYEWFSTHRRHLRPNTESIYLNAIDNMLVPTFKGAALRDITRRDIEAAHVSYEDKPMSANIMLSVLSVFFNWCIQVGYWSENNPVVGIKRFKSTLRERFLSQEELTNLTLVLTEYHDRDIADVLLLLLITGARPCEIRDMRWEWVNAKERVLRIPNSKSGASTRFLPTRAMKILLSHGLGDKQRGRVFDVTPSRLADHWVKIKERATIEGLRIHDLRHNFASVAASKGLSLLQIGALLGHSSTRTTERYAHLIVDSQREAMDLVQEGL